MPLPEPGAMWPPVELASITPYLMQWSAWYSGEPAALQAAYGGRGSQAGVGPQLQRARDLQWPGARNLWARFWWGRHVPANAQQQRDMIHVPIASDICQGSADLLFSEPPKFTVTDTATQERLDDLGDDNMFTTLGEAAEVGAALGGVYLRVTWDRNVVPDQPFLTAVHADAAIPTFMWDRLVAVTFWRNVKITDNTVWRHLERHELDNQGVGIIQHGLYEGTPENLGRLVPLTDMPEFAELALGLVDGNTISTETPGLAVVYVPNQRPQRRWRSNPAGASLGRSDLDGVESLMDALDETYSSWMRDIRLGKARLLVAKSLLEDLGPGQGQSFDGEQELYSAMNALADMEGASALPVTQVQFAIRYAEHQQTAEELRLNILRTAGYSSQTFGEGTVDRVQTATEIQSRERRSLMTQSRKIRLFKPPLRQILEKLLAVDQKIFGSQVTPQLPEVDFPDSVQETPLNLANTALALSQAEAASREVLVALVHPDWDDDKVMTEVALIVSEQASRAAALPDPFSSGGDGGGSSVDGNPNGPGNDPTGSAPG